MQLVSPVTAPDLELTVTACAVEEVRALVAAISSDFDALRHNAAAARAMLEERYAAVKAEGSRPAAAFDDCSASYLADSIDESRGRLASAIDAAESSKAASFEAELVRADVALEALIDAINIASDGAADLTMSGAALIDTWATTWMPQLRAAFAQSSRLPAGPETDSSLSLVPLPAAHSARLGILVTRKVAAGDVALSGLRALIPTALPTQEALCFMVQFTEAARAAPGFDAESAVAALAASLRVDAVAASVSSLGGVPPPPRTSAPLLPSSAVEPLPWACPTCKYTNSHWRRDSCERCGGPPPQVPLPLSPGGGERKVADALAAPVRIPHSAPSPVHLSPRCWPCPTCGLENAGMRESCEACEDDRPPLLQQQAGPAAAAALPVSALRITGTPAAVSIELDALHARITVRLVRPAPSSSPSSSCSVSSSSHALVVRGVSLSLLLPVGRQLAQLLGPFPAVSAAAVLQPPFAVRLQHAGLATCASTAGEMCVRLWARGRVPAGD